MTSPSGYRLVFADDFDGPELDRRNWLPLYLPQWSSREAAAARYAIADSRIDLTVTADQPAWCPEFDGDIRVSSLQTGLFAGPLGSPHGQVRFNPALRVREEQPEERLYVPRYGNRRPMRCSLMVDVYELRAEGLPPPVLSVDWVRGWTKAG